MFKFFISVLCLLSATLFATTAPQLSISDPELSGNCVGDDIAVVQENGEYYIAAYFTNMDAIAEHVTIDKKRCTMRFNVELAPGYQLDVFQFSVDGVYQLSQTGTARLTVSHRVANNPSARTSLFYSASDGDPAYGDIHDFSGAVDRNQLPSQYGVCGASIPLTTSIYAEAVKPSSDRTGLTRISLDEGVSSAYVKLAKVICKPCQQR
jgi:hypothetical protein